MRHAPLLALLAALLPSANVSQESSAPVDSYLALGVRQVNEGSFEDAVFSLDTAVRRLTGQPARSKELTRAYVYLGAAYVGLDHEDAAKGKFRKALELDPTLRLSPDQFPPRVIKVFEEQILVKTAAQKKRGAKVFLILGGVGAAAAVGVSVAGREPPAPPPNRSPTGVGITTAPEGQAIVGVTVMTLAATAADPEGDVLTFRWDLGDGGTADGATVMHRYDSEGTFRVGVTARDGSGASATASASVVARSLSGSWDGRVKCTQTGSRFECRFPGSPFPDDPFAVRGTLSHPRVVNLDVTSVGGVVRKCSGEVQPTLDCLRCLIERLTQRAELVLSRGGGCK